MMSSSEIMIATAVVLIIVAVALIVSGGSSGSNTGGNKTSSRQYSVWPTSYAQLNGFNVNDPSPLLCQNDSSCTATSPTSVTCPNSLISTGCQTTLPVAQAICDATSACSGVIFHVADATPFATPVTSSAAASVDPYPGGYGTPAVYLTPGTPPYGALTISPTSNYYGPFSSLPGFDTSVTLNESLGLVGFSGATGVLIPPSQDPFYSASANLAYGYPKAVTWIGDLPTPTTPPITPYNGYIFTPAAPLKTAVQPFVGWSASGNQYVVDNSTQQSLSAWQGVVSNDTNPITCPNQTLVPGGCATDLATAGMICDSTSGCVGLIYNISDPVYPTATPVNTTPVAAGAGASAANGGGSVFMTPAGNETSGSAYYIVEAEPNTVWGVTNVNSAVIQSLTDCNSDNATTANSCGGILVPTYNSAYQVSHATNLLIGNKYDTLTTVSPSTSYTNAISLTYTIA
jgi:hypothetical protein